MTPAQVWQSAPPQHRHQGREWLDLARDRVAMLDRAPHGTVVEYGCGGGAIRQAVAEEQYTRVDRYLACDIVPAMLEETAKRGPIEPLTPEQFYALPSAIADVVLCCAVLWHMPTHDDASNLLAELARLLKRGGCGVITARWFQPGDNFDPSLQPYLYEQRYLRSDAWRMGELFDKLLALGLTPTRASFNPHAQTMDVAFRK